jgi:hypothetical protein
LVDEDEEAAGRRASKLGTRFLDDGKATEALRSPLVRLKVRELPYMLPPS